MELILIEKKKFENIKKIVDYLCKIRENTRVQNNLKYKETKELNIKRFMGEVYFFINVSNYNKKLKCFS